MTTWKDSFWGRKDVNTLLSCMSYHRRMIKAGKNNLYKFWKWQAEYYYLLDLNRELTAAKIAEARAKREREKKPKSTRRGRPPKWKPEPLPKHNAARKPKPYITSEEQDTTPITWTPSPLSWD